MNSQRRWIANPDKLLFAAFMGAIALVQLYISGQSGLHDRALARFGNSWNDLASFQIWRLGTSSLIQADQGLHKSIAGLLFVSAVIVLIRISGRRAFLLWFAADALACVALFVSFRVAEALGSTSAVDLVSTRDAGSSTGALAIVTAGLLTIDNRRTRVLAIVVLLLLQVPSLVLSGKPAYAHHIFGISATVLIQTKLASSRATQTFRWRSATL